MGAKHSTSRIEKKSQKSSSTDKSTHEIEDYMYLVKVKDVVDDHSINEDEIARLNTHHFLLKELWGGTIFSAPITKQLEEIHGFRVLDVG